MDAARVVRGFNAWWMLCSCRWRPMGSSLLFAEAGPQMQPRGQPGYSFSSPQCYLLGLREDAGLRHLVQNFTHLRSKLRLTDGFFGEAQRLLHSTLVDYGIAGRGGVRGSDHRGKIV